MSFNLGDRLIFRRNYVLVSDETPVIAQYLGRDSHDDDYAVFAGRCESENGERGISKIVIPCQYLTVNGSSVRILNNNNTIQHFIWENSHPFNKQFEELNEMLSQSGGNNESN